MPGSGRRRSTGREGRPRGGRLVSAGLFLTFGLVAAFVVSAVAGARDDGPGRPGAPDPASPTDRAEIRVEVLNGAGTGGLAREATHRLRGEGFDVVFFGNAARFDHRRSVVIDRIGDPTPARAVAAALGIDSVATAPEPSLMLEVTVVLGEDWPPVEPATASWTDRIRETIRPDASADSAGSGP